MQKFLARNYLGIIGLVIGLIAIAIAIFQNDLRPAPEPEDERTLTEVAGEAASKLIKEKILKEEAEPGVVPEHEKRHDAIAITYMALGFIAMVLGITSWIRKDHIRLSGGAIAVGLVAVGWEYVLVGLLIGIVILVIANFSA